MPDKWIFSSDDEAMLDDDSSNQAPAAADARESVGNQVVVAAARSLPKKRGRPFGLFGNRELREVLRQQKLQQTMIADRRPRKRTARESNTAVMSIPQRWAWLRPLGALGGDILQALRRPSSEQKGQNLQRSTRLQAALEMRAGATCTMTIGAEAAFLGCSRTVVFDDALLLASLTHETSRTIWASFCSWMLREIQYKQIQPIAVFICTSWDETPTRLNLLELLGQKRFCIGPCCWAHCSGGAYLEWGFLRGSFARFQARKAGARYFRIVGSAGFGQERTT